MLPYCLTIFICVYLTGDAVDTVNAAGKSDSEPAVSAPVPVRDTLHDSTIREADMRSMQSGNWLTDNAVHVGMHQYVELFGLVDDGVSQVVAGP